MQAQQGAGSRGAGGTHGGGATAATGQQLRGQGRQAGRQCKPSRGQVAGEQRHARRRHRRHWVLPALTCSSWVPAAGSVTSCAATGSGPSAQQARRRPARAARAPGRRQGTLPPRMAPCSRAAKGDQAAERMCRLAAELKPPARCPRHVGAVPLRSNVVAAIANDRAAPRDSPSPPAPLLPPHLAQCSEPPQRHRRHRGKDPTPRLSIALSGTSVAAAAHPPGGKSLRPTPTLLQPGAAAAH